MINTNKIKSLYTRAVKKVFPKKTIRKPRNPDVKVTIRGLHKAFYGKKVLRGVDIDIFRGQSLVIIGGSGSGKSVLIKNIMGIMRPNRGSVKVDGREMTTLSQRERNNMMFKFGMLFQGGALFDSMPVWKNITFALLQSGKIKCNEAKDLAVEKLASVGLDGGVASLYPSALSGGMQKRVALARAIADNPEIILFDEPTTGLDPIMADIINDLIIKCSEELGATTITITHDMHSARRIADNVAMLYRGKIMWHDKVGELDKTDNSYIRQFINGSAEGPIKIHFKK